ncbi:histidine kinase [Olivibacter sp. XZL3]|uniref:histidine kinase n=1 Tax=Olivibacter sp. XZL3 TaxID=1735116 RepID=UPI001416F941|nr:histidine kinase [Olivibacter sp. XZL3]
MDNYRYYIKAGISRWDFFTIFVYWLIVAPAIYFYNTRSGQQFEPGQYLPLLLLTILMDTLIVIALVFYVPQLWYAGTKWNSLSRVGAIALLLLAIGGFGLVYMMAYRKLYYGFYVLSWGAWIGGIVQHVRSYGLLFVITYFRKSQADKNMLLRTILDKEREERKKLRNRISPHFLVNSLNGIQPSWVADAGKPYMDKLMDLMTYFTYSTSKDAISQEEEIRFIQTYLDLMDSGLPYPENLDVRIFVHEKDHWITPGILVQLLENVFKHGTKGPNDRIAVELTIDDRQLFFMLENAIVGNTIPAKTGAGMEIAQRLLALHYPKNHRLNQFIEHGKYHVHLVLNLKNFIHEGKDQRPDH